MSEQCSRCQLEIAASGVEASEKAGEGPTPALSKSPLPGADGELVLRSVCAACWEDWRAEEVRTINELRLNFMDPAAQKTLRERMLSYLGLAAGGDDPLCDRTDGTGS